MNFEKYKLETTETEVNTISVVTKNVMYGGVNDTTIICAFLTLKEAQEMEEKLENENKTPNDIFYDSFCVEIKVGCQHPKEAISENAYGDKQCCKCRQYI